MLDEKKANYKNYLEPYIDEITQPSKGEGFYICPLCGSGTGANHTGAFKFYPNTNTWHCFACNKGGDIFNLIEEVEHIQEFPKQIEFLERKHNLTSDTTPQQKQQQQRNADYTPFYKSASKNIQLTDYHRGISDPTLSRFNIGYVSEWKHPKSPNTEPTPRLIIPIDKSHYIARLTSDENDKGTPKKSKVGAGAPLFNYKALQKQQELPLFVVEGEIDAMSLCDVGFEAVALGGLNANKLINAIAELTPSEKNNLTGLIIALDSEKNPNIEKVYDELKKTLKTQNIAFTVEADLFHPYKDANEVLQADRDLLAKKANEAVERFNHLQEEEAQEAENKRKEFLKTYTAYEKAKSFIYDIQQDAINSIFPLSTGFKSLDDRLGGGLTQGVHVVGAVSGLGKTSLAMQVVDYIASTGTPCVVFNLEMSTTELIARSIARESALLSDKKYGVYSHGMTHAQLMKPSEYIKHSKDLDLIVEAQEKYESYAKKIFFFESVAEINVNQMREFIELVAEHTGKAPFVLVDYLQIVPPLDVRDSDRRAVDRNVTTLKRISRDLNVAILVVSSFNRDNYRLAVGEDSFKESGGIEYTASTVMGLQLSEISELSKCKGKNEEKEQYYKLKAKKPREIDLMTLKSRASADECNPLKFEFWGGYSLFKEIKKR